MFKSVGDCDDNESCDAELNLCHIVYSHSGGGTEKKEEGSLIGSGEYSLVYEANDGDRMLVGDVPWK